MGEAATPSPTFPPPEVMVESLRRSVTDAVVRALAGHTPETLVRELVAPAVDEALREHVRALEERLLRVERLVSAGQLSAGVAHELRNPLAVIETSVFILRDRITGDPRAERQLRRISDQVATATAIVNDLLETVRDRPVTRAPVDLAGVVREALARVPRPSNITVALDLPSDLAVVDGDARRLIQVALNLLSNAVQALSSPGRDDARIALSVAVDGPDATLTIEDNGPGIPDEALPRLFDPLFSTRPDGTGLGLALSRRIMEAHGGSLTAANAPSGGARFTLRLSRRGP